MNQYINGYSSDWVERIQYPHGIRCRKPEDVFSFADDNKSLKKSQI